MRTEAGQLRAIHRRRSHHFHRQRTGGRLHVSKSASIVDPHPKPLGISAGIINVWGINSICTALARNPGVLRRLPVAVYNANSSIL